jgi:hypothetical protein
LYDDGFREASKQKQWPGLLLTFEKDDNKAMSLTLGADLLEEYLEPIAALDPRRYMFCSVNMGVASLAMQA